MTDCGDRKSSFAAVVDARTRLVVLGSLPGEASLRRAQYYAAPTNQFWRLMEGVIDCDLVDQSYETRLERLTEAGVGLWDVIATARRAGSLDAGIRDPAPNALAGFAAALPHLRALAFNGAAALRLGRRQLGEPGPYRLVALPSSSAAYCAVSLEQKAVAWRRLRDHLA